MRLDGRRVAALLRNDLRNVVRDPMLLFVTVLPLGLALGARFVVPFAQRLLGERFDLGPYHLFIVSMLVLIAPYMYGWVIGFLLLDERDEDLLVAIAVTPLSRTGFVVYRLALPTVMSFVLAYAVVLLCGLAEVDLLAFAAVAMIAALEAPLLALTLAAVASNKVEGMAVAKGLGVLLWAPLAVLFVDGGWQWAAGVVPTYWVSMALVTAGESLSLCGVAVGGGLMVHGLYLGLLVRRFEARLD